MNFSMIHHVNQDTIDWMFAEYAPVFVLTTGRTGSRLLVELLNCSSGLAAFHEPRPTLQYYSNFAFHHQNQEALLRHMITAARMESILEVMIGNKIYVESNQCLAFFAPALGNLFPNARFIHLVRHPGDFVRSAWRKGWHRNDSIWESGRARLGDQAEWDGMDLVEKLAWLWTATNRFVDDFLSGIAEERIFRIRLEDLTKRNEALFRLAEFCGGGAPDTKAVERLRNTAVNSLVIGANEPPNMRKRREFPQYREWSDPMREILYRHCSKLAERYEYSLDDGEDESVKK